jgi:hypothetical protein
MDNIFLEALIDDYISDKNIKDFSRDDIRTLVFELRKLIRSEEFLAQIFETKDQVNLQRLLYTTLDQCLYEIDFDAIGEKIINATTRGYEIGIPGLVGGFATIVALYLVRILGSTITEIPVITSALNTSVVNLRKWIANSDISKWSENKMDQEQIVLNLLDKKLSNCTKVCNVEVDDSKYFNLQRTTFSKLLFKPKETKATPEQIEQVKCLASCYLDYVTSLIAETKHLYAKCLEKTTNPVIDLPSVRNIAPLNNSCDALRKDLDSSIKELNIFIKHVYKDEPRMAATWLDLLNKKIEAVKFNRKITDYGPISIESGHHKYIGFNT